MNELFRCRVPKALLSDADKVSKEMGSSTPELVRIFLSALVKWRALPFNPKADGPKPDEPGRTKRTDAPSKELSVKPAA